MGIDLLCFSIMSNHFHLVLRSRPDVVQTWDDTEVARRWLRLCPPRKAAGGEPAEPTEAELNSIRTDPVKLKMIRLRLSDMSWWMRLLCQHIGSRANREEEESGKFFQGRFEAVRLLDEAAIVACAADVDLNPIRAALAETPAILERLGLEPGTWSVLVKDFGKLFSTVAGRPRTIDSSRTLRRRHHMRQKARELPTV